MLHFEKEPHREGIKCSAGGRTSPSLHVPLNERISAPSYRCANFVVGSASNASSLPPKLPARPNSVSLMEHQPSSVKNDFENGIKIGDVNSLLKAIGDDTGFVEGSYVRFAKSEADLLPVAVSHEYCYPSMVSHSHNRDPSTSGRTGVVPPSSRLPMTDISSAAGVRRTWPRVQCIYCCEPFDPEVKKGRPICRDAPDRVMDLINVASCACVADTVAYHCFADSEGEYEPTCTCLRLSCRSVLKWTVLVLLSMFLPCLCCFWPLVGCRRCAMFCGYCVPRHRAA